LWDEHKKEWDCNREFFRKAQALSDANDLVICLKLHVESFSRNKGTGEISWSFAATTTDLIKFIYHHFEDPERVSLYEPLRGERRKVIAVPVESFAGEYEVVDIGAAQRA